MHRNSLLFGVACLIVSMPDVNLAVKVDTIYLDGKVGPIGAALLAHGLFLATLYCFGAFLFEWHSQARPLLAKELKAFQDVAGSDRQLVQSIRTSLAEIEAKVSLVLTELQNLKEIKKKLQLGDEKDFEFFNRQTNLWRPEVDKWIESLKDLRKNMFENFDPNIFQPLVVAGTFEAFFADCEKYAEIVKSDANRYLQARLSNSIDLIGPNEFDVKFENVDRLHTLWRWSKFRAATYLFNYSSSYVRLVVLGILIPAVLNLTAIFHFFGKYYFSLFPSILTWWLARHGISKI